MQCEKILREIASASQVFMVEAMRELNALEGMPGQPNVRLFQGPQPVDGLGNPNGEPRPRDKVALIAYFHALWSAAVWSRQLTVLKPQVHARPGGASRTTVDSGMAVREALPVRMLETGLAGTGISPASVASPSQSLTALAAAGVDIHRGDTTTSDFTKVSATALEAAVVGEEDDFSVVQCYDTDDTSSIEMICYTCRGLGHAGASCPSAKKMRTLDYAIGMLTKAKKMSEEPAASQGDAKGGKRPLPRGQQTPFKAFPRRSQQKSNPHRRFIPAKAKSAEAEDEDDDEGFGYTEEEPEGAGSAMEVVESQAVSAVSREVTAVLERDGPRQRMPIAFSMDEHFETGQRSQCDRGRCKRSRSERRRPSRHGSGQAWASPQSPSSSLLESLR